MPAAPNPFVLFLQTSSTCLDAIVHVFQNDVTGSDSLNLVRMLAKTIKSRSFRVHPAILASLLHLRFGELNVRAGTDSVTKDVPLQPKSKLKEKKQSQPHISKKARKAMKLKKEVEKEYAEAELTVTNEERERDVRISKGASM